MLTSLKILAAKAALPFFRAYWRIFKVRTEGARMLVVREGRVLLVKAVYQKRRQLPGGGRERGETPEATALRETLEETGLRARILYKLGTYLSTAEGKRDTIHVFVGETSTDTIAKEWEIQDADWYALDTLPDDASPATRRRIGEYLDGRRDLTGEW